MGQIAFEYSTAKSHIDLSSGGIADWPQYGRNQEGTRYTPLNQINRDNVAYLRKAWEYHTVTSPTAQTAGPRLHFKPHPFWSTGFAISPRSMAVSSRSTRDRRRDLDIRPGVDATIDRGEFANRGVTYWRAADAVQGRSCERRIFVATVDARLIALDAARGTPCPDFGQAGQVDLSRGVDLGKYQADTREYGVIATGCDWRPGRLGLRHRR